MKLAIIDLLGLTYDGTTLQKRGLGGSESAVILMSKELAQLGFDVTVYNNCIDSEASPGIYDNVRYVDHTQFNPQDRYDVVICSRTVKPWLSGNQYAEMCYEAKYRVLWMHDTFCEGDQFLEQMIHAKYIDEVFTLSDFHSNYVTTCDHGARRNFEMLKHKFFMTRNGAVKHIKEVDTSKKDPNLFVYNASATKGLIPLVTKMWPEIKKHLPQAKLFCIGGYYRFREGAEPDEQEKTVRALTEDPELKKLDVTFTGVIPQYEIAEILSKATLMLYPTAFPETFGISSLESLLYKTPIVTNTFGALEETAIDLACYKIPYSSTNNALFRNIDEESQVKVFVQTVLNAVNNPYLLQQKQNYCDVVNDIYGWDTVALQWKQHIYKKLGMFLPVDEYREAMRISNKVARVYGRRFNNVEDRERFQSYGRQQQIIIVSPFWNAENYISNNILSVAQQDYDNYYHILIDDCSSDNSYQVASDTINSLPYNQRSRCKLIKNESNMGAIWNQLENIRQWSDDAIIMLLDGDDWLVNNNSIFHLYNDLYNQGYDFTYGSMWSLADNIPLIAQTYPDEVIANKSYRQHRFNWGIPYTHLRTFRKKLINFVDETVFYDYEKDDWMRAGADNPLFYELIEQAKNPYAVKEIVVNYNDINPLNDYKVRGEEQNLNASKSNKASKLSKKFSVITPTMWREPDVFKHSLENMVEHPLVDEIIIINNSIYDTYDWKVLANPKIVMINEESNTFVNPAWNKGVALAKNDLICIANDDIWFDVALFDRLQTLIKPSSGAYGMVTGDEVFNHPQFTDMSINFVKWKPGDNRHGFGQLMFVHKSNWTDIPDQLKVYYGDDVIFNSHLYKGLDNYLIYNFNYHSPMASTTKDLSITGGLLQSELPHYLEWDNMQKVNLKPLADAYEAAMQTNTANSRHLRTLKQYADKCYAVTEFGAGVSTTMLLNSDAITVCSYDLSIDPTLLEQFKLAAATKNVRYQQANSKDVDIPQTDLLFIDTNSSYSSLRDNLLKHHQKVNKYIAINSIQNNDMIAAVLEFMRDHPHWQIDHYSKNDSGFMVIKRDDVEPSTAKKILVAIPTNRYIEPETFKAIYDLDRPVGYEVEFQYFYGYQIDQIRNLIAEWGKHYDYLFCVDSDIVMPKDTLVRMISHDKDIVSALYIQRIPNTHTLELYRYTHVGGSMVNVPIQDIHGKGLVPIDGCGFGCVLIKGDVLRAMTYPHFFYKSALNHKDTVSEDVYFCMKANELGFHAWADSTILCDHVGKSTYKVQLPVAAPVNTNGHTKVFK